MQLASNEHVVKTWDYLHLRKSLLSFKKCKSTLTITNRRFITTTKDKFSTYRREIQLDAIQAYSVQRSYPSWWALLPLLISFVLLIYSFVIPEAQPGSTSGIMGALSGYLENWKMYAQIVGGVLGVLSVVMLILFRGNFSLILYIRSTSRPLARANSLSKRAKSKYKFVKIDKKAVESICEELGAHLLNQKR